MSQKKPTGFTVIRVPRGDTFTALSRAPWSEAKARAEKGEGGAELLHTKDVGDIAPKDHAHLRECRDNQTCLLSQNW